MKIRQQESQDDGGDITPYPQLVITNSPTKLSGESGLQLKPIKRKGFDNNVETSLQKSQLLLSNNSAAASYFPDSAETHKRQSKEPPTIHMTKRITQVSQLLQSTNQPQRIVDAYNNLSRTIEQSNRIDKSASSTSLSQKMPPVPQTGRSGQVSSHNVTSAVYSATAKYDASRKPPYKQYAERKPKEQGYSASNHWQLPSNNRMISNRGSDLSANNRLATLKKEQLQRGMLNQMNGSSNNLLQIDDQQIKASIITQATPESNGFSPMKIVQQQEDDDKKYLILNNYHYEQPFKDIISAKSQFTDPFSASNPLLLSAASHRDESIYYRQVESPNKKKPLPINLDQSAYANLMIRDGSLDSIQQASNFYPTQTFDASLSNRRSLDEGISALRAIDQQAQMIPMKRSFKESSPSIPKGQASIPMKHAQQSATLRQMSGANKASSYKRSIVSGNSSHFRHSSNSVKKALLAQINNGSAATSLGLTALSHQSPSQQPLRNFNTNLNGGSSIEKPSVIVTDQSQSFQYRVVPTITYESSTSVLKTESVLASGGQVGSPMKIHTKKDGQYGQPIKKFGKFNNMRQSHGSGFDDINQELQNIIEKERALTDEIIKNSLVRQNGRFNFEALAHLNDIIESKKNLKKKFGVEGLSMVPRPGDHCMVIKSYSESQNNEVYDQVLNTNVIPNESLNEYAMPTNNTFGVLQNRDSKIGKNQRISDIFLKNILTQHKITLGSPSSTMEDCNLDTINTPTTQNEDPTKMFSVLSTKSSLPQVAQQSPVGGVVKLKKKKKSPREDKKKTLQQPKIKIYHEEDASKKHIQDHQVNKAIQKINYLIRLIFKYQNSQKESNPAPSSALMPNQATSNANSSMTQMQQPQILPTMLQAHQVEEQRLQEIQRVAIKWFGIALPLKKLESKAALREYFQSREFTVTLRNKMNHILHAAINRSNNMIEIVAGLQQQQAAQGQVFQRFYVGWGNNDAIVRSVLKQRHWWQQCASEDFNECSFMWTQWKKQAHLDFLGGGKHHKDVDQSSILIQSTTASSKFELINECNKAQVSPRVNSLDKGIKLYNRMEQNKQLTNKKGVFLNMREYYYLTGKDPFEVLPVTFLIKTGRGTGENDFMRFQLTYSDVNEEIKGNERQRILEMERRVREIRFELQKKREQARVAAEQNALRVKTKKGGVTASPSVNAKQPIQLNNRPSQWRQRQQRPSENEPEETDESDDEEQSRTEEEKLLIESDEQIRDIKMRYPLQKNIWIVKPGENTNRGNGINVCSELNEIKALVLPPQGAAEADSTFIIQRYIDNPLLIHGRKFDFRCYGVLTSINGCLKGYFYEDAYIRTSCKEFDIEDVHNKFIHLTNDAVQKYSADYGKYENGNKLSMSDFQKYLKAHYGSYNIDVWRDIMPQIRKLVTDSYRSVYGKIDPSRLHNSFELFGYDFMLDSNFRLYLIEVNTNPCLEMSCPLLARIIPEVLDNTFRIVLDPIFPAPSGDQSNNRKYQLIPQEIKYTLVFDEESDGPELKKMREEPIPFGGNQGSLQQRLSSNNPLGDNGAIGVIDEIESDQEDDLEQGEDRKGATSQCGNRNNNNQSACSKKGGTAYSGFNL
ncbi:hypothetical protein FGO68_gene15266 [Halteria grandinella]|uniref:Tubulin-tyrosine ligase family protein n=1 Tax=Halteria grandinella TaxID=5974 RepID=A0A8J8TA03_HALGN|nr:hypothetical protein FGO68_gene15266 [Halteria grandinella]